MKFLVDGTFPASLGDIAADNQDMETADLEGLLSRLAALAPGETITESGGAGAEWTATRVTRR